MRSPFEHSAAPTARVRRWAPATAALVGALLTAGPAQAVPVSAADFQIRYYTTDENGDRGRLMTTQDLQQYVNRARCECNQLVWVEIALTAGGQAFDQNQIRAFAGTNCASGQQGNTDFNRPCVQLDSQLPNYYTTRPTFRFPMIWLGSGVTGGDQSLGTAVPESSCDSGFGDGGIWICVESNGQNECQPEEFIITGTQNSNGNPQGGTDPTGMMMGGSGALQYDYDPPLQVPTQFEATAGDGAIRISWPALATEIGYLVLCADADGNPVPGKGVNPPALTAENNNTIYYTESNLCPDGPFDDTPEGEVDNPSMPTDEGGSDDGGTGFATDDGRGVEADWDVWAPDPVYDSHTGTGGTSGGSGTTGADTGAPTGTDTGAPTGTGTGSGTDDALPSEGIESLSWDYICSGPLGDNANNARIDGLNNDETYQFLVVAYDLAGNPIAASDVLTAIPRETTDLWEQCQAQGDICGDGGYCQCTAGEGAPAAPLSWGALGLLGLVARRRRRSSC